ncbi:DUF6036 family nucleotidyltransferase [Aquiflexum sp.]|uniref:DUF6036 family nucleotidyltransferase n=1 Tax=Aquiflexum sp. TaxID=1872584 RepID=UPI0035932EED
MIGNFPKDFLDFLESFNKNKVEYILVGGFSVILHGYPRTTGDIDIWVKRSVSNFKKIQKAFFEFGMPLFDMTEENFMNHPDWDVYTFGRPPVAIDIMLAVKGLDFDQASKNSIISLENGISIRTLSKEDLIKAKTAVMRPKDLDDLANL